eukprot:m.80451 g.80451  ORF g.80451 m.80451 type:complete len:2029 (+) comp36196_c0_seq4:124-6210(+)
MALLTVTCFVAAFSLAVSSSNQSDAERIVELERQISNLTSVINVMKSECEAQLSAPKSCECRRNCTYRGVERLYGASWNRDVCTKCTCDVEGAVVCSERGENAKCIGGCLVGGVLYANGETYAKDVCTSCTCRNGTMDCQVSQCPSLPCAKKVNVTGQCCPRCLGCVYLGRSISYGRRFRPNACTFCNCLDDAPSPTCRVQNCPPSNCKGEPVTSRSRCCPFCQDCPTRGNGESWSPDECTNCTCLRGEEQCVTQVCPPHNCSHPVKAEGECCSSCTRGCFFDGHLYREGELFNRGADNCTHCQCVGGSVTCETEQCTPLTCSKKFRLPGQCCEQCPTCEVNGRLVGHNQLVLLSICERCLCYDGGLTLCQRRPCQPITCSPETQYRPTGRCCPTCRLCQLNGRTIQHGETFVPSSDSCAVCKCENTEISCQAVLCSANCSHPVPSGDSCCQNCSGCMYEGVIYDDKAVFTNSSDKCSTCECQVGNVVCSPEPCPNVLCDGAFMPEGSCCPVCPPKNCVFENETISHLTEVQSQADPCIRCICSDGILDCTTEECHVPCSNPLPPSPDTCCSSCEVGCLYQGNRYSPSENFSIDDCTNCQCLRGNVSCQSIQCPLQSCGKTKKVPGQCCPVCQVCSYEGNRYEDGDQFISVLDPCLNCSCMGRTVSCRRIPCVSCSHPHPKAPRDCCPACTECYWDDVTYQQDISFVNPKDNCSICSCRVGNITCSPIPCPKISCDERFMPAGSCCPVCLPKKCDYEGKIVGHLENVKSTSNACIQCLCKDGQLDCVTETCNASCTHPLSPPTGQCCSNCLDGCLYEGSIYSPSEEFDLEPCTKCTCERGSVSCSTQQCPPLSCSQSVTIDGQCCPVCQVCNYENVTFEDGDTFLSPSDPCLNCTCLGSSVSCDRFSCPSCSHPLPKPSGVCCSECSDCWSRGRRISNFRPFRPDACTFCRCMHGNITCDVEECPTPSCKKTKKFPRICCPVCQVCTYGGQQYDDGDLFPSVTDPCEVCECRGNEVNCSNVPCETCLHPAPSQVGSCCLNCTACQLEGTVFQEGARFRHPSDPCLNCQCLSGSVACEMETCSALSCRKTAVPEGECCPVCQVCGYEGVQYDDGDNFVSASNPCVNCTCRGRLVQCGHVQCSNCTHPALKQKGQCCDDCELCVYEETRYRDGASFVSKTDPCQTCLCDEGNVYCLTIECPDPPCRNPISKPGQCCQECPPVCVYEGITYENRESWTSQSNPCLSCSCQGEESVCQEITCPSLTCSHPEVKPGQCCSECGGGCIYNNVTFEDRQTFYLDHYCRECTCIKGNVICVNEECPPLNCSVYARADEECCPRCRPCLHGIEVWEHGDVWSDGENPCLSFHCTDGIVSEFRLECAGDCQNVQSKPNQCCSVCPGECVDNGKLYSVNESFSLADNPCIHCTCEKSGLRCIRETCPVQVCRNGNLIKFEMACCPICLVRGEPEPEPVLPSPRSPVLADNECSFEGRTYLSGQFFLANDDPCQNCSCTSSDMDLGSLDAEKRAELMDFDNRVRSFGSSVKGGQLVCQITNCPVLPCPPSQQVTPDGQCCKTCDYDSCIHEGLKYQHNDNVWMDEYGCDNCTCNDGELVSCRGTPCPVLVCSRGTELKLLEGECCTKCVAVPPCVWEGKQYQHGQTWRGRCRTYTCNRQKVTITEQDCPSLQCRENEIPDRKPTECCSRCVPKPASCEAFGDPHYKTFDGYLHHYQGECYYVLARDCKSNDFTVLVQNDRRGYHGVSWTQDVTFNRGNVSVSLLQGLQIRINGQPVDLPFIFPPYVYVKLEGGRIALETDIGVTLTWNGDSIISVNVPSNYANGMCGLCGNFNGNPFDDLRLRDGRIASDLNEFGGSWQVKRKGDKCDARGGAVDPCQTRSASRREEARKKCSVITSDTFKPCHKAADSREYFYSCMFDVCACRRSDSDCLCSAIEAYANECTRKGVQLGGRWRTGPCAFRCPTERGFIYDDCAPPCRETCDTYHQQIRCLRPCVAACTCLAGRVEHNGHCIQASNCPRS